MPGFYDHVRELTRYERDAYASLLFSERAWTASTGAPAAGAGERGYTLIERLSGRPSLEVLAILGGALCIGGVVPARSTWSFQRGAQDQRL